MRQWYEMYKEDGKTYGITVAHARNTRIIKKKAYALTATYPRACPRDYIEKSSREIVIWQFRRTELRIHSDQEKTCTLTANMGTGGNNVPIIMGMALRNRGEWKAPELNGQEKANSLTTVQTDSVISDGYFWRKLTCIECERLQTLPDNFSAGVSNSRRYKAIGNGWTVDVIAHILSFCNF
jgi:site-specific DNA-cytosine methylase